MAQAILDNAKHPKCSNENALLPRQFKSKDDDYLKEIAAVCGIEKKYHIPYCPLALVRVCNADPLKLGKEVGAIFYRECLPQC